MSGGAYDGHKMLKGNDPDASPLVNIRLGELDLDEILENIATQLTEFLMDHILDIIEDLTGLDLRVLVDVLQGINLTPEGILSAINAAIMFAFGPNGLPLLARNIIGQLLPSVFPLIPLGSIGDIFPNILSEYGFDEAITIDTGTGFYWAGGFGRTKPGCAAINADGTDHVLVSDKIPVAKDQQLEIGTYVTYDGLTAGPNSIKLEIVTYDEDGNPVSTVLIAQVAAPGASSLDWSLNLHDEYTIPDGVDYIAVQLRITSSCTTGTVRFDDAWVKKLQRLKIPFIDQLPEDLQAKAEKILGIINRIYNGWANLGELIDLDRVDDDILVAISGLLGIGLGARADVSAVEARVRALETSATTIIEDFARQSASSLGPNYAVRNVSGGGAGSIGLDGKGNGIWIPSGAGNRTQYARRTDMTVPSDGFLFRMVMSSNPQSYIFDDAFTYFLARMNTTSSTLVRLRLGWGTATMQAVVSDAVTNLGSPVTITSAMAGKTLEWQGGEAGNTKLRHFTVKLDNTQIIDVTDGDPVTGAGAVSSYGAAFRSVGIGMETGNRLIFFQNIPAGCAFYSVSEIT